MPSLSVATKQTLYKGKKMTVTQKPGTKQASDYEITLKLR